MTAERAFAFGRTMAYLLPANLIPALLSAAELRGLCEVIMLRAMPKVEQDKLGREQAKLGATIEKRLSPQAVDELVELGRDYYRLRASFSMRNFMSATAYGTDRVGFLFAGDVSPAVSALKAAAGEEHMQSVRLAIKELVTFSVSVDYFNLRKQLGLAVKDSDAEPVLSLQ